MSTKVKPIFLFSLPRSGSTAVQRILGGHGDIATTSETWILLPYLYTLRKNGSYTDYWHSSAVSAIEDFYQQFPHGEEDYKSEMREFVSRLYAKAACNDESYFLDKTPRYHLVAEEIIRLFPQGKFVFLWRNPLAVVASIMETWGSGRWNLHLFKLDLFSGLENLLKAYHRHEGKVHAVRYEDILTTPAEQLVSLFDYLELPFDPSTLRNFSKVKLRGGMGDPTGVRLYSKISQEPLEKWRSTLTNPVRKAWCRRYLRWIGNERLALMGYNLDELLAELDSVPTSPQRLGSDALRSAYGTAYQLFEPAILKHKLRLLPKWSRVHAHR